MIDVQDLVEYQDDIGDPSKYGLNPGITPSRLSRNFGRATLFGDIVAVNGQPAKGLFAGISRQTSTSRNPSPGGAIADLSRIGMREIIVEILKPDGTPVGTIMSSGFSGSEAAFRAWAFCGVEGNFANTGGAVGRRITDEEFAHVNLTPAKFHGEWNYAILPNDTRNL